MTTSRHDQAQTLRTWFAQRRSSGSASVIAPTPPPTALRLATGGMAAVQVIAVASGKGGVGKTSLVTNLAIAFAQQQRRVLALDGNLGLANLDFTFGVTPRHTVLDVLHGHVRIDETLVAAPGNVTILPACHGRFDLANLSERQQYGLFSSIDTLDDQFDILLIDTAAGIGANAIAFAAAAQQIVVISTSEPTSVADSYAFVKVLRSRAAIKHVHIVANMVHSGREGELLYARLSGLFERFLDITSEYLGSIPMDPAVALAIRAATPLLLHTPQSAASLSIVAMANKLRRRPLAALSCASASSPDRGMAPSVVDGAAVGCLSSLPPYADGGGIRLFWRRLLHQAQPQCYDETCA